MPIGVTESALLRLGSPQWFPTLRAQDVTRRLTIFRKVMEPGLGDWQAAAVITKSMDNSNGAFLYFEQLFNLRTQLLRHRNELRYALPHFSHTRQFSSGSSSSLFRMAMALEQNDKLPRAKGFKPAFSTPLHSACVDATNIMVVTHVRIRSPASAHRLLPA